MDILIWLLVAISIVMPKGNSERGPGNDRVRSVALLLSILYLIGQAS